MAFLVSILGPEIGSAFAQAALKLLLEDPENIGMVEIIIPTFLFILNANRPQDSVQLQEKGTIAGKK